MKRTLFFVLVGALLLGGVALAFSPELIDGGWVACGEGFGEGGEDTFGCQGNRTTILGAQLSNREIVVWSVVLGALIGTALGLLGDRVTRRT